MFMLLPATTSTGSISMARLHFGICRLTCRHSYIPEYTFVFTAFYNDGPGDELQSRQAGLQGLGLAINSI